jgi:thiamine-monophosphate kinase
MPKGERDLVRWLTAHYPADPARVPTPIGDDMAELRLTGGRLLVAADMLLDDVHFDTRIHTPQQIGRKALACNLSDCAAMAVRPVAATVSLALPNDWTADRARALFQGMDPLAREFDMHIVGGDTNSWTAGLVIDVCILAEPWPGLEPVRRGGAKPGDLIVVTGPLGGSIRDRHIDFPPRVREARELHRQLGDALHAMMDITDGLSLDLWRMCEASAVGAMTGAASGPAIGAALDAAALDAIASNAARAAAAEDNRPLQTHVLEDGEDFELLCAVDPKAYAQRTPNAQPALSAPLGRFTDSGLEVVHRDGSREPLQPRGWEHFK